MNLRPGREATVWLAYASVGTFGTAVGIAIPIISLVTAEVAGGGFYGPGILGAVLHAFYAFVPILAGFLFYRFNTGMLLACGLAVYAGVMVMFETGWITGLWDIVIVSIGIGTAIGFIYAPLNAVITGAGGTQFEMMRHRFFLIACLNAGFMVGPLIGGILLYGDLAGDGYGVIFDISTGLLVGGVGCAVAIWWITRGNKKLAVPKFGSLKWIARFPRLSAIVLFASACYGITMYTHPVFLSGMGLEDYVIEVMFFMYGGFRLGVVVMTRIIGRMPAMMLVIGTASMAAGMGLSATQDLPFVFTGLMLIGFGISVYLPLALDMMLAKSSKEKHMMLVAEYEVMIGIGAMLGCLGAALFSGTTWLPGSPNMPYLWCLALGAFIVVACLVRRDWMRIRGTKWSFNSKAVTGTESA